jgi:hypothetical protein
MSMVSHNGVVYFLGRMAFYSFDGQTIPQSMSEKIEPWILNDPFVPGYPMTQNWNLTWAAIYNNRLHLGYCSSSATPNTILCYDLRLEAWTVLTTTPGLSSMVLFDAPDDPDPYTCYVGSSTTGQVYQWDYVSSSSNAVAIDGVTTAPVLAQVQSKYFKVGVPGTNKALQRFYPEFLVSGMFSIPFTVALDYGRGSQQVESTAPGYITGAASLEWGVGLWDMSNWGGPAAFVSFGAPYSRLDFAGTQGEAFAFGAMMNSAAGGLSPWVWTGGTGVFSQRGKT